MVATNAQKPFLGFGLGLRTQHYTSILNQPPLVDWFEVLTENYLVPGGKPLDYLDKISELYPIVMHGVSLSIGSCDPLDVEYLQQVKALAQRIEPKWISDHLCWTGIHGNNSHDLLPIPYTEKALQHVTERISQVQDFLGRQILIENVSSYLTYQASSLTEWQFLAEISNRADCLILLDINNVYVSAVNHEFNPLDYITALPKQRVYQIHLAGHETMGAYLIDTHDQAITQPVWQLYRAALRYLGPVSTMIERDEQLPPLADLVTKLEYARRIAANVLRESTL